jgi:predicted kinase
VTTPSDHDSRPTLVVFSGLPGTGKSELARQVAGHLSIAVLSVDPIESAMLRAGIAQSFETGLAAYLVVEAIADAQLALGQSVIVDAVNGVEPAKAMWRTLATKHRAPLKIVECVCSNEALHRERLSARHRGLDYPEPTWEKVQERKLEYTAWTEPLLRVDSVDTCEANTARVLAWLTMPWLQCPKAGRPSREPVPLGPHTR